jgi:hypothetical protein
MSDDKKLCIICHDEENTNELTLTRCQHSFHKACLDPWKEKTNSCPMCRVALDMNQPVRLLPPDTSEDLTMAQALNLGQLFAHRQAIHQMLMVFGPQFRPDLLVIDDSDEDTDIEEEKDQDVTNQAQCTLCLKIGIREEFYKCQRCHLAYYCSARCRQRHSAAHINDGCNERFQCRQCNLYHESTGMQACRRHCKNAECLAQHNLQCNQRKRNRDGKTAPTKSTKQKIE